MPDEKSRGRGKAGAARSKAASEKNIASVLNSLNASRAMVIANPVAGGGAVAKIWDDLLKTLRDLGLGFDFEFTERPEHAIELAREAAESGYGMVVAVGGDGTVFEVVNGIMTVDRESRPKLGIIPVGPCDICLTLGIPQEWLMACPYLVSGKKRSMDVGWMEYASDAGARTGYFANIAGLGFEGEVTERASGMPEGFRKAVGGMGAYLTSLVVSFAAFKEKDIELVIDGETHRVMATSVIIANCKFFGAKMCIAPDAECDDGLFDVLVIGAGFGKPAVAGGPGAPAPRHSLIEKGTARLKMARYLPKVYRGTHLDDDSVMVFRAAKVKVMSGDKLMLQADGEVIGEGPFEAEVIKNAIDVIA